MALASATNSQDRRTGFDRRSISNDTSRQLASGVYIYHGHVLARTDKGWKIHEPSTGYEDPELATSRKEAIKKVDERLKVAKRALAEEAGHKAPKAPKETKQSVEVVTTPTGRVRKPRRVKVEGNKTSEQTIAYIRSKMAPYFEPGGPRGKVKAYQDLALELGLGIETVARIARGDTHSDVR